MKKLFGAAAAVLSLALVFTSCGNPSEESVKKQKGTVTSTDDIVVATNYVYGTTKFSNYQVNLNILENWKLAKDDVIKVTFKATSDTAVKAIQANFVDTTPEASYWTVLNNPSDVVIGGSNAEDAVATTSFELESEYKIGTAATAKGAAKFVVYISPESAGYTDAADCGANGPASVNLTDVELTIELNPGVEGEEIKVKDPLVIFDAATITAPDGMEIATVGDDKYLIVMPDGYNTSISLGANVNVTGYSKVEVVAYSPEKSNDTERAFKFGVQLVDWSGNKGPNIAAYFDPAPKEAATVSAVIPETAAVVTHIQPFVQSTAEGNTVLSDKEIYIKTITLK